MYLTVKALKELIKDLPDKTVVLAPSVDHCFHRTEGCVVTVSFEEGQYYESYEGTEAPQVEVLVIQ